MLLRIVEAILTGFIAAVIIMFLVFDLTKLKRILYPPANDAPDEKDNQA